MPLHRNEGCKQQGNNNVTKLWGEEMGQLAGGERGHLLARFTTPSIVSTLLIRVRTLHATHWFNKNNYEHSSTNKTNYY